MSYVNSVNTALPSIAVNLDNIVLSSDTLSVPFNVDAGTNKIDALQFEVFYDSTKIRFTDLSSNAGNWMSFATLTPGKIRFGGVDKTLKYPVTGKFTPFALHFQTLQPGTDINTVIRISPIMDAADATGNQLGINLNTSTLKIIGSNNF